MELPFYNKKPVDVNKSVGASKDQVMKLYRPRKKGGLMLLFKNPSTGTWKGFFPLTKDEEIIIKLAIKEGRRREREGIIST